MKAYKGFNADMSCRNFQYEQGKEYHEDKADLCKSGFHACERPLDCFAYYPPSKSVYHEVDLDGMDPKTDADSKRVGQTIKIGARLDTADLCKAQFEYVKSHTTMENTDEKQATAGECGAATAGNRGAATAGNRGAATAGYGGAATAGYGGAATAGEYGAATAGYGGAATAGNYGAATSRGTATVGTNGIACVRGNGVMVRGGIGAVLVIAEEQDDSFYIKAWKAAVVDGEKIKADTWYKLENGEFSEAGQR